MMETVPVANLLSEIPWSLPNLKDLRVMGPKSFRPSVQLLESPEDDPDTEDPTTTYESLLGNEYLSFNV